MKDFLSEINNKILIFDGSKGYMLQKFGMKGGECPELWNVEHSDEVRKIYSLYKCAGSDVIQTNTFTGNRINLDKYQMGERTYELNFEGARIAREVMGEGGFVAASIGPIGKLMEPMGDLTFDKAYELFKEQVQAVVDGGVDIVNFETFTDVSEMRAALLAAKDITNLPIICSISFESNGRTLMGTEPETAVLILKSLGADIVGTNCSFGPELMVNIVSKMHSAGAGLISVKPNAGLPEIADGITVYKETAEKFANLATQFVKHGARLIGGCCGTTPEFISAIRKEIDKINVNKNHLNSDNVVNTGILCGIISSGVKCINVNDDIKCMNIGKLSTKDDSELFNKLISGDLSIVMDKVIDISEEGYDCIHITVDNAIEAIKIQQIASSNCKAYQLLAQVVNEAQGFLKEPFILETKYPDVLEMALRVYKGRAGVIVSKQAGYVDCDASTGNKEDIEGIESIARKYGALTI